MPRFRKSQGMQGFESRGRANLRPNQVSGKKQKSEHSHFTLASTS